MTISLPEGVKARGMSPLSLREGKKQVYGLLADQYGRPVEKVKDAVLLVHIQVRNVTGNGYVGVWLRSAMEYQIALDEYAELYPKVWVVETEDIMAHEPVLQGKHVKAMRCQHTHNNERTGYAGSAIWGDLKPNPKTLRTCPFCNEGMCLNQSTGNSRGETMSVKHQYTHLPCHEARAAWKKTPAQKRKEEEARKKAAEAAAEAAARKERAQNTRRANRIQKLETLANHPNTPPAEAEAAREALRRMGVAEEAAVA